VTTLRVVGLDLSLTSTGVAWLGIDDGVPVVTRTMRIRSVGAKDATLYGRHERIARLVREVCSAVGYVDLLVIEQPAYSRTVGSQHDRSGLWWLVIDALIREDHARSVAEVAPTGRARYATGKGNAGKDEVLAAAIRRFPGWDITGNDVADAVILAAMGARHLGHPIDQMPAAHLTAMAAVRWPDTSGAAA
jgi:crossover junction endodeoxyribonuclease RuvC